MEAPKAVVVFHLKPTVDRAMYELVAQKSDASSVRRGWPAGLYYTEPHDLYDVAEKTARILSEQYGIEFVAVGSQDVDHSEICGFSKLDDVLNAAEERKYPTFEFNSKTNELSKYPIAA